MGRNLAMMVSGIVTAFVMMIVVGLLVLGGRFNATPAAAQVLEATNTPAPASADAGATAAEVATLRAQVKQYQDELQKAYQDLQNAYNQIQAMDAQNSTGSGSGGRQRGDENEGGRFFFGRDR